MDQEEQKNNMDQEERKNKIISGCNGIPSKSLAEYIKKGVVNLSELPLKSDKRNEVIDLLAESDDAFWNDAKKNDTVEGYSNYLSVLSDGKHSDEAKNQLSQLEAPYWEAICGKLSKEGLEEYLKFYPNGKHVDECKTLLDDPPYLEVRKKNTIKDYEEYKKAHPGEHTEEIDKRIEEIIDDNDWATARANNTIEAYQDYLVKHPNGRHAKEARSKINNRSGRDVFIDELRNDPNRYNPREIQNKIANGVASWEDLSEVFDQPKIGAIRGWRAAAALPDVPDLDRLPKEYTEVYFWGTRSTGKTCLIGSVLGSLNSIKQNFIPIQSPAEIHRIRLANLFSGNNRICTLPDSTNTTNLPAMPFRIRDERSREHQLMLIDMAGEAFKGIFKMRNNMQMTDDEKRAVRKIDNYLLGSQRNPKIHFFVIEYGGADKYVDPDELPGIRQIDVLESVAAYFRKQNIFQKTSVGVYVVITKCDKIEGSREERAAEANRYVTQGDMGNFVNNLRDIYAKEARLGDFKKISFSIGEVFAKGLCVFDDQDTDKIIEKLLLKSPWVTGATFWDKLIGWLRYH